MKAKRIIVILAILLIANFARIVVSLDAIAITAPPWDYCNFTHNHIGKAFTCIAFDSDVVIIK